MNTEIKIGMVVRDPHGQIGIVCSEESTPPRDWIDDQVLSAAIKKLGRAMWWGVQLLSGGYALAPGPLLEGLREATYEDFLAAADAANVEGRKELARMFPRYLDRVIAERAHRDNI